MSPGGEVELEASRMWSREEMWSRETLARLDPLEVELETSRMWSTDCPGRKPAFLAA
jgi:hypothetical protein